MDLGLSGHTVVVSGASRGIGLATARMLLDEGAQVCGFARDETRLHLAFADVAEEIRDRRLLLIGGDAGVENDIRRIVAAARERFGCINAVVVNAGEGVVSDVNSAPGAWRQQFLVKVVNAKLLVDAVQSDFLRSKNASIVIINGVTAHHPDPEMAPISAARAALASYASMLGYTLAMNGIRVVAINVGAIATDRQYQKFVDAGSEGSYENWLGSEASRRRIPFERFGTPDEVAATVVFLISGRSSYTAVTSIDISGGMGGRT